MSRVQSIATAAYSPAKEWLTTEQLIARYHGEDHLPCPKCDCPIFNCSHNGELHCAACESRALNDFRHDSEVLRTLYPVRFDVIKFHGRYRLCEWTKSTAHLEKIRERIFAAESGKPEPVPEPPVATANSHLILTPSPAASPLNTGTLDQATLDALRVRNRALQQAALQKLGKRR